MCPLQVVCQRTRRLWDLLVTLAVDLCVIWDKFRLCQAQTVLAALRGAIDYPAVIVAMAARCGFLCLGNTMHGEGLR